MVASSPKTDKEADRTPAPAINTKQIYTLRTTSEGPNYTIASCCAPIPGDEVLGFVRDDGQVEIHTLDCPRANVLKAAYGTKIVATEWAESTELFLAHIRIEGIDRRGILQEITQLISSTMAINMRKLDIEASGEVFHADLWVEVSDASVIIDLNKRTKEISGVTKATRIH